MADSEEKSVETQPELKAEPTAIVKTVRGRYDNVRSMLVDSASGRFMKQPKRMPETREVTRQLRNFLNNKAEVGGDGRLTKSSKSLLSNIFENIASIALNQSSDPKAMMAAVAAAEWLMLRGHGKPSPGDAELGALEKAGVRVVVITSPDLMHKETLSEEERQAEKPVKPSFADIPFIEGEVVDSKVY